jgi:hypothetical protein
VEAGGFDVYAVRVPELPAALKYVRIPFDLAAQ